MSDSAPSRVPPPPLPQHLRELRVRRDAWLILARNLIPVVGIYGFGWSAALAVFNYWFDGLAALAAILLVLMARACRESQPKAGAGRAVKQVLGVVLGWMALVAVVGLPYWIVLIPLNGLLLGDELRARLAQSPGLWLTYGMLAGGHFWKAFHVGYDTMPERELKQRVRWDSYLLFLRAIAMFLMGFLAFVLVPLMALLLSYFEIWPERVIAATFGDPSKLWEYDPDGPRTSDTAGERRASDERDAGARRE
jgi:hypothetical protein